MVMCGLGYKWSGLLASSSSHVHTAVPSHCNTVELLLGDVPELRINQDT